MTGWFKTHRKMKTSPIFSDPYLFKLWMLCLMKATHKEHEQLVGNQTIKLEPGQFVTGRISLTNEYNYGATGKNCMKEITIWRWLKSLEKMEMLNIKSTNKYSVVTIVNWVEHQNDEQQMNNKRTTNEQQMNTNKNVENEKNEKKETYGEKVLMTKTEYKKLIEAYPKEFVDSKIEDLDIYMGQKGKKYKDHYMTLRNWLKKDAAKIKPTVSNEPQYKSNSADPEALKRLGIGY